MKFKLVTKNPKRTPLSNEELAEMLAFQTSTWTWMPGISTSNPGGFKIYTDGSIITQSPTTSTQFVVFDVSNTGTTNETEI